MAGTYQLSYLLEGSRQVTMDNKQVVAFTGGFYGEEQGYIYEVAVAGQGQNEDVYSQFRDQTVVVPNNNRVQITDMAGVQHNFLFAGV